MTDITTPFQKRSYTSIKAAAEKDKDGSTSRDCKILLAWMQQRHNAGEGGIYIFEAAKYLSLRHGQTIPPGTASARLSDLMSDKKCLKYFGCPALVKHGKDRKKNPDTGKTGGIYILKSLNPDDAESQTPPSLDVREAGVIAATVAPAAAARGNLETLAEIENAMPEGGAYKSWMGEVPPIAPKPDAKTIVYESPDADAKEVLESAAGRRVASDVRAGRAPQLDFGFGRQLPRVN